MKRVRIIEDIDKGIDLKDLKKEEALEDERESDLPENEQDRDEEELLTGKTSKGNGRK